LSRLLRDSHASNRIVHLGRTIRHDGVEKQKEQRRVLVRWAMWHLSGAPKTNLVIMGDFNEGHPVGGDGQALGVLFQAKPPLAVRIKPCESAAHRCRNTRLVVACAPCAKGPPG